MQHGGHGDAVDSLCATRIALWNMERGGRHAAIVEQQLALLSSIRFDVAILTEPPAECALDEKVTVLSPPLR